MRYLAFAVLVIIMMSFQISEASTVYQPLLSYSDPRITAYEFWDTRRQDFTSGHVVGNSRRPVLLGISGRNLELLQDGIARKYYNKTEGGQLVAARYYLAARVTEKRIPVIRGYMAEALYLEKNPEYKYVKPPNAPHVDVYRNNPTGGPGTLTGQIKYHMFDAKTAASMYARDMLKDNKPTFFIVPDDHVDALKQTLIEQGRENEVRRIKAIGYSYQEIDKRTRDAIAEARYARVAPYVLLGTAITLSAGPTIIDWYRDDISDTKAMYKLAQSGSLFGSGVFIDQGLKKYKGGILRGTMRGNIITMTVFFITDTGWEIYEHGGVSNAVNKPIFLINTGGNISAVACGGVGAAYGAKAGAALGSAVPGKGTVIGVVAGGLVGGIAGGYACYYGGSKGTHWALEKFAPQLLYQDERQHIAEVQSNIENSIKSNKYIK